MTSSTYQHGADYPRATSERVFLYQPDSAWTYSHHASITRFGGRYYAIWSNGRENEDELGQRILIASSDDFTEWTEPAPLIDSQPGRRTELVLTAAGFHQHEGTLVVYAGRYELEPDELIDGVRGEGHASHVDTALQAIHSTDGLNWSDPIDLGLPIIPNTGPQATASGRLIIAGNIMFPYTDDPSGLSGWEKSGVYPASMVDDVVDDSQGFPRLSKQLDWPAALCEGAYFQTDDQTLHMLLRSFENRLWETTSVDDGTTWSAPEPTGFPDNGSKFHFGRLPDGRFYYVGNPDPEPPRRITRNPLVLSISADGESFDRHWILADEPYEMRRPGLRKGGVYGYPHSMVDGDGICVIVSVRKEAVLALRVPLETLA